MEATDSQEKKPFNPNDPRDTRLVVPTASESDLPALPAEITTGALLDVKSFRQMSIVARWFASSTIVPDHYRDKPANCLIALDAALRLRCHPLMFMQRTYVQDGKLGMEGQLVIALINQSGLFEHPLRFRVQGEGDEKKWIAYTKWKDSGEEVSAEVTMATVKAEGWYGDSEGNKTTRGGDKYKSKWATMGDQMGKYRAAAWFARVNCPDVTLGIYEEGEFDDIPRRGAVETTSRPIPPMPTEVEDLAPAAAAATSAAPDAAAPSGPSLGELKADEQAEASAEQSTPAASNGNGAPAEKITLEDSAAISTEQAQAIWRDASKKFGDRSKAEKYIREWLAKQTPAIVSTKALTVGQLKRLRAEMLA